MEPKKVNVAIGVLVSRRGGDTWQVLISRRKADTVLAGFWEFPGGKIEPGEPAEACLVREFQEELGVRVRVGALLGVTEHTYDYAVVRLSAFFCGWVSGEPRNLQVAEHRWVPAGDLGGVAFPPANQTLVRRVMETLSDVASGATLGID